MAVKAITPWRTPYYKHLWHYFKWAIILTDSYVSRVGIKTKKRREKLTVKQRLGEKISVLKKILSGRWPNCNFEARSTWRWFWHDDDDDDMIFFPPTPLHLVLNIAQKWLFLFLISSYPYVSKIATRIQRNYSYHDNHHTLKHKLDC